MPISDNQILQQLTDELRSEQDVLRATEKRITKLKQAIAAMNGQTPETKDKTISEMCVDAAIALAIQYQEKGSTTPLVFDAQTLRDKVSEMNPNRADYVKTNIYNGIALCVKQNKFERAPGGYQIKQHNALS